MNFFLSGVDQKLLNSQLQIQHNNPYTMPSINSKAQYKLGTLGNKNMKALYTPGIIEEDYLKHQLLKECKTTSQLIALSKKLSQQAKKKNHWSLSHNPRNPGRRNQELSPGALQRKYLGRSARRSRPHQAHPAAKTAPAASQVQPPQTNIRIKRSTSYVKTTDRITLTPFKPGFEQQTELELSQAFKRPPRKYKEDPPFYPWLPITPIVQFNLNYKC